MINGEYASFGLPDRRGRRMSRSSTTIERTINTDEPMPRTPIHPGEHLADELREIGMSAAGLARQIAVPVNRITGILNGQRGITADTALRLAHWFGTTPAFWLNLQQLYELRRAEAELGDTITRLPKRTERASA
jgi:addiction module HigA family antidote